MRKYKRRVWTKRNAKHVFRDCEMALLYRSGLTLAQVGQRFEVTREYVRQRLRWLGLAAEEGGRSIRSFLNARDKIAQAKAETEKRESRDIRRWGATSELIAGCSEFSRCDRRHPIRKYSSQRYHAIKRGISWELTFTDWWRIWQDSGHWEQRGRGQGYVMARWADDGPYSPTNVYICTQSQNSKDSYITKPAAMRVAKRARTLASRAQVTSPSL